MRKLLFYIFLLLGTCVSGQQGFELGGWIGTSLYFGDLHTELTAEDPGLNFGFGGRYNFDERISAKLGLNYARIKGDDFDSPNTFERERNLSFFSDVFDVTLQAEFNFLPYIHGSRDQSFTPYLFAGASLFAFSPKAELNEQVFNLRDFGTEGQAIRNEYSRFSRAWTFGVGFKFDIDVDWSINIEAGVRNSQTDYLDDVSGVYPDLIALGDIRGQTAVALSDRSIGGAIGEQGRQRGNSRNNDTYVLFNVGIVRYFGSLACPKLSKHKKRYYKRASTLEW